MTCNPVPLHGTNSGAPKQQCSISFQLFCYATKHVSPGVHDTEHIHIHFYAHSLLFTHSRSISLRFNCHFLGGPGLANTRLFPFWISLGLKMTEVVATTAAIRRAKLQPDCHYQQTNIQFFTGRMPLLSPNQQCQSTEGSRHLFTITV